MRRISVTVSACLFAAVSALHAQAAAGEGIVTAAKAVETGLKARVGVMVVDTQDGRTWSYRETERFPMASTFKTLACATLIASGKADEMVTVRQNDLLPYSPVTEKLTNQPVPVSRLCDATLRTSDNTAANKVLDAIGGPQRVTEFLRKIGDDTTRLDRREPDLNEAGPGDARRHGHDPAKAGPRRCAVRCRAQAAA